MTPNKDSNLWPPSSLADLIQVRNAILDLQTHPGYQVLLKVTDEALEQMRNVRRLVPLNFGDFVAREQFMGTEKSIEDELNRTEHILAALREIEDELLCKQDQPTTNQDNEYPESNTDGVF